MKKAVLFDCWGTCFFNNININPYKVFARMLGQTYNDPSYSNLYKETFMLQRRSIEASLRDFLNKLKIPYDPLRIEELNRVLMKFTENIEAYPETLDILKQLRKNKIKSGLVTDTTSPAFEVLEKKYHPEELFDVVVKSYDEDVKSVKPDPKQFQIALQKLKVKAEESLMVGDNPKSDIETAEKLRIKAVLIDRVGKYEHLSGIEKIHTLWEIQKYLHLRS
jgi:putative hydrolase of the HAD superfamily